MLHGLRALTLDLDDTLWPIAPVIERAEVALHRWLEQHAPAVARRYDVEAMRLLRNSVARERPEWAHDLSRIRHTSIGLALRHCGEDPALADAAFAAYFDTRNQIETYPGVDEALAQLARRFPLLAVTNGNADLARLPVGRHFAAGTLSARTFGVGKPDARIFHEACRRLGCAPQDVLHVGDDWALDVRGAADAGLHAAWLRHPGAEDPPGGTGDTWVVPHLQALADRLAPL